jgi:hypothetical protein
MATKESAFPDAGSPMSGSDRVTGLQGGTNVNFSQEQISLAGYTTSSDTALGIQAGANDDTTHSNVFAGVQAGFNNTTGNLNVVIGYTAAFNLVGGNQNVVVGWGGAVTLVNGSNNTLVGYGVNMNGDFSNATALGQGATALADDTVQIGDASVKCINVGAPTTVGALPSAATVGAGARAFVTNATATLAAGLGNTVVGGGADFVPVYSDGTNWKIG